MTAASASAGRTAGLLATLAALAALLGTTPALAQGPLAASRRHAQQADSALRADDYAAARDHLLQALRLRPGHPGLTYNLAAAYALSGAREEAVAALRRYAAMGLVARPEAHPAFQGLAADPGFAGVLERFAANARPVGQSTEAFQLSDPRMVPEGIAHDPATGDFFVSSVRQRRIVRVDAAGREQPFAPAGDEVLWSVLGLAVDPARRLLWAASAAMPQTPDVPEAEHGQSALFSYDLETGRLAGRYVLPPVEGGHALGDLAVHPGGDVYVSDGRGGVLYVLRRGADALEPYLPAGILASPQGLCFAGEDRLYLADYSLGVLVVDLSTGAVQPLTVPPDQTLLGIDGLTCAGDRLLAIQNGVRPERVLRLRLGEGGRAVTHVEVVEANNALFDQPTLGVLVGADFYYIANSHWSKFDERGHLEEAGLRAPVILKVGTE